MFVNDEKGLESNNQATLKLFWVFKMFRQKTDFFTRVHVAYYYKYTGGFITAG